MFSLTFLLLTEDVNAFLRRLRIRKVFRKAGRVFEKIAKIKAIDVLKKVAAAAAVTSAVAAIGKRSTDNEVRTFLEPDILKLSYD